MKVSFELAARPDESRRADGDRVEFGGFLDAGPSVRSTLRLERQAWVQAVRGGEHAHCRDHFMGPRLGKERPRRKD
jgi:hypothetical protein